MDRRARRRQQLLRKPPPIDPTSGIWDISQARSHFFDSRLAEAIPASFGPPQTLIDLGCGLGDYCDMFTYLSFGKTIIGFEGTPSIQKIAHYHDIRNIDLSAVGAALPRADFVLCLEVGEHVPQAREQTFIGNVTKAASNILLLSWAVPGQTGVGHVNERPNDYVIAEIEKRGFVYCEELSLVLRASASLPWFKNTLMVFLRIDEWN